MYKANKNCARCKGTGWMWIMVGNEPEKDMCDCVTKRKDWGSILFYGFYWFIILAGLITLFLNLVTLAHGGDYTITPGGNYVAGKKWVLTPKGYYVGGDKCVITPSGEYVGVYTNDKN